MNTKEAGLILDNLRIVLEESPAVVAQPV